MFVGDLNHNVTSEDVSGAFGIFGEVVSTNVVTDFQTGFCKGYGFVHFATAEAQAACLALENHGVQIQVRL